MDGQVFLEQGIMARLVELLGSNDSALRLNALWAIKNLLRKTTIDMKRDVMDHLGWRELSRSVSCILFRIQGLDGVLDC
jgi:hypothetical protein